MVDGWLFECISMHPPPVTMAAPSFAYDESLLDGGVRRLRRKPSAPRINGRRRSCIVIGRRRPKWPRRNVMLLDDVATIVGKDKLLFFSLRTMINYLSYVAVAYEHPLLLIVPGQNTLPFGGTDRFDMLDVIEHTISSTSAIVNFARRLPAMLTEVAEHSQT